MKPDVTQQKLPSVQGTDRVMPGMKPVTPMRWREAAEFVGMDPGRPDVTGIRSAAERPTSSTDQAVGRR